MIGLPLVVLLGAIAGLVAMVKRGRAARDSADDEVPAGIRLRSAACRWAGLVLGVLVAGAAVEFGALGRGPLLAAPLFGLCVLAGVLAGELTVRPPAGTTRRAAVEVRRTRDYLPRGLSRAVLVAAGALAALLAATTATASPDDLGRAGRALALRCTSTLSETHGPWAGSFYSGPLAAVVFAGLAAAALTLHRITRRSRPGDPASVTTLDDALRRRAASAVLGACGILLAIPLTGSSLVTATVLFAASCPPAAWTVTAWALLALIPAWLGLLGWSAAAVLYPSAPLPTPSRAS